MHDDTHNRRNRAPESDIPQISEPDATAPRLSIRQRLMDRVLALFYRDPHPGMSADERERRRWDKID